MKFPRHAVAALVIFAFLTSLTLTIYNGFEASYGFTPGDIKNFDGQSGNIAEQFQRMALVEGVAELTAGIDKLNPGVGSTDLLGGLASVGVGALKTMGGLISAPFSISRAVFTYYAGSVPGIIVGFIVQIVTVYLGFILLSAYLNRKV